MPLTSKSTLLFSFDYPPNDGGIARLCAQLVKNLAANGVKVHVLSQDSIDNTSAIDLPVKTTRVTQHRPQREWDALSVLRKSNDEICISGIWYPEGMLAQLAGFKTRIIFALGAELFPPRQRWRQGVWRLLQRFVLERASVVVAISHYTGSLVKKAAPNANVVVVPLAVDINQFFPQDDGRYRARWQIEEDQRVLCSVSRIQRFKGHEIVLEAMARLPPEKLKSFIYLVAGKGPDLEFLQSRAQELAVDSNVRWVGFVADEDLPALYSASDLFVLMTRELPDEQAVEGFGLVFLEAQACGTPVVGTRTGGIPDAIKHGDGGWLIEQDDIADLTRILLELYDDPNVFRIMGDKARQRIVRECTWNQFINQFIAELVTQGIYLDS